MKKNFSLNSKPNENIKLIQLTNQFTFPPRESNVILLLSGGIDSSLAWIHLVDQRKYHVYPLVLLNDHLAWSLVMKVRIRIFSYLINKKFPHYHHSPFYSNLTILGKKLSKYHRDSLYQNTDHLLHQINDEGEVSIEIPGFMHGYYVQALTYIQALQFRGIKVNTIFTGIDFHDGDALIGQTQTAIKLAQLTFSSAVQDKKLQIASVCIEESIKSKKEINKQVLLKKYKSFPHLLHITLSCDTSPLVHCGKCKSCQARKYHISQAIQKDPSFYLDRVDIKIVFLDLIKRLFFRMRFYEIRKTKVNEKNC